MKKLAKTWFARLTGNPIKRKSPGPTATTRLVEFYIVNRVYEQNLNFEIRKMNNFATAYEVTEFKIVVLNRFPGSNESEQFILSYKLKMTFAEAQILHLLD